MKRSAFLFVMMVVIGLLLVGCGDSYDDEKTLASEQLVSEKTLPVDFYEVAEQGVLVKKATNEEEFMQAWDYYRIEEGQQDIDWENELVVFLGIFESGTCPLDLRAVELNDEKTELTILLEVDAKDRACTDDATPRTFVFVVDADEMANVTSVEIFNYHGLNPKVDF